MEEYSTRKSWFARNWKWVVPAGGCLFILIAIIVFAGSMIVGLTNVFKESTPYQEALEMANSNEQLEAVLGTPIEKDGMVKGSFTIKNSEGHANFDIPVKGPKGEGTLYLDADRINDSWVYNVLEVVVKKTLDTIKITPALLPQ